MTITQQIFHSFKALVFWLYAKPEALEERLDRRVDDMLSVSSHNHFNSSNPYK